MLNVNIKLVQYDSLKRFGVPNEIIYIFLLLLLVILRESVINLCRYSNYAASITSSLH